MQAAQTDEAALLRQLAERAIAAGPTTTKGRRLIRELSAGMQRDQLSLLDLGMTYRAVNGLDDQGCGVGARAAGQSAPQRNGVKRLRARRAAARAAGYSRR